MRNNISVLVLSLSKEDKENYEKYMKEKILKELKKSCIVNKVDITLGSNVPKDIKIEEDYTFVRDVYKRYCVVKRIKNDVFQSGNIDSTLDMLEEWIKKDLGIEE